MVDFLCNKFLNRRNHMILYLSSLSFSRFFKPCSNFNVFKSFSKSRFFVLTFLRIHLGWNLDMLVSSIYSLIWNSNSFFYFNSPSDSFWKLVLILLHHMTPKTKILLHSKFETAIWSRIKNSKKVIFIILWGVFTKKLDTCYVITNDLELQDMKTRPSPSSPSQIR